MTKGVHANYGVTVRDNYLPSGPVWQLYPFATSRKGFNYRFDRRNPLRDHRR